MDRYQGQQNDFILLSLVRTRAVGHLRYCIISVFLCIIRISLVQTILISRLCPARDMASVIREKSDKNRTVEQRFCIKRF